MQMTAGRMMVRRCAVLSGLVAASLTGASAAEQPLADAAQYADWGVVRALVEEGADVTVRQGDGATALHWAAYWDEVELADLLVRAGADVNAANDLGVTPLWAAAENCSAAMVERLLDAGANPNAPLLSGETPLMTAARVGAVDVSRELLKAGADTAATGGRNQTALMWAVAQRHADVVEALLAHGAAVDARSDVWTEVVKTTPEPWNPEYVTEIPQGGYTPLLFAARVGDLASAKLLVAAGADVNDQPPYGTSATVVAAHSGHAGVAAFLLEQGADPNAAHAGYTALHAAILHKDATLARALLDHGADPAAPVKSSTPVRRDAVDFYLHPSYVGATPFWLAARFNAPDIMRLLLERGADPLARHYPKYWPGSLSIRDERVQVEEGATTALMAAGGPRRPRPSVLGGSTLAHRRERTCAEHAARAGSGAARADDARRGHACCRAGNRRQRRQHRGQYGAARRGGPGLRQRRRVPHRAGRPAGRRERRRSDAARHRAARAGPRTQLDAAPQHRRAAAPPGRRRVATSKENIMSAAIEQLVKRYEGGGMTRRDLVLALSALVMARPAGGAAAQQGAAPAPIRVRTMNHVTLSVSDVQRSVEFYQRVLGLPLVTTQGTERDWDAPAVPVLGIGDGPQFIALARGDRPHINHYCLGMEGFDAAEIVARLAEHGIEARVRMRADFRSAGRGADVQRPGRYPGADPGRELLRRLREAGRPVRSGRPPARPLRC